jgi:hypothetical protein
MCWFRQICCMVLERKSCIPHRAQTPKPKYYGGMLDVSCTDDVQLLLLRSFGYMLLPHPAALPANLFYALDMTPPLRYSSSSGTSSSSSNDKDIFPMCGLPNNVLVGLVAMDSGRKRLLKRKHHCGSRPGKRPNRNLGREEAGCRLHADFFFPRAAANPHGGVGPTFTPAEFERRLRINPRVCDRVKVGVLESDRC